MNRKRTAFVAIMLALVFGIVDLASAQVQQVGNIDDITGFPMWYRDRKKAPIGSKLALCLDPVMCIADPPIVGNALSQQTGFGKRAWYWHATATLRNGATIIGQVEMGLGATYTKGAVAAANRITDNFVSIKLQNLPVNGTYTVIHPFGQNIFNVTSDPVTGIRSVNFLNRVAGKNFSLAMNGPVGRFMVAVNPAPPVGFIGNPKVLQTVMFKSVPARPNFVQIIGPLTANLGGTVKPNEVIQRKFQLMGQEF